MCNKHNALAWHPPLVVACPYTMYTCPTFYPLHRQAITKQENISINFPLPTTVASIFQYPRLRSTLLSMLEIHEWNCLEILRCLTWCEARPRSRPASSVRGDSMCSPHCLTGHAVPDALSSHGGGAAGSHRLAARHRLSGRPSRAVRHAPPTPPAGALPPPVSSHSLIAPNLAFRCSWCAGVHDTGGTQWMEPAACTVSFNTERIVF